MVKKKEEVEVSVSDSNVDKALKLINKQFGPGAMMTFNSAEVKQCDAISTGSISLDLATGVSGLPLGRFVEIFGPESSGKSTICLQVCAEAQKAGYTAAFLDLENAFDAKYAKALGIDLNKLLFSQPSSMEEAFQMMEMLMTNKLVDVIIFDSIASGRTKAELNGEIGDNFIGTQARIISQALKKLAPIANEANCLCLFTNQIRMKIGVMFGCFHYNTRVLLADGTTEKIGKIVNNKLPVNVLSYNKDTNKVESKKIINWFNNGKYTNLYKVTCAKPYANGISKAVVADDHTFITKAGEKRLSELKVGDNIYIKDTELEGKEFESFIVGSILGDGSIRNTPRNTLHTAILFKHSVEQNDYCHWKESLIPSELISSESIDKHGRFEFSLKYGYHFTKYLSCKKKSRSYKCNLTDEFINNIDLLSMAIWYLDDGTFCAAKKHGNGKCSISAKHLNDTDLDKVLNRIEQLNLPKPTLTKHKRLLWSGENCKAFQLAIAKYVPSCMRRKINKDIEVSGDSLNKFVVKQYETVIETPILSIDKVCYKNNRAYNKFDLQIEDNSNYFVDGMLVHNSPETTPGGLAMQFYASIRMRIAGKGQVKEGDIITARETEVKIIKNKVAPPFTTANFVIRFGKGIDKAEEVLDYAVKFGLLEKSGAWFKYNGENVAQGKEKALSWLKSNTDLMEEFTKKVKEFVKASFEQMEDIPEIEDNENIKFDPETGEILED